MNNCHASDYVITRTDNPERNSFAFITSLEEDGGRVVVFFDKNVQFDGDQVNKATSIHRRTNIVGLMNNLSDNSIIYVKNKNEFDTLVGMADSIPAAYKGKIKFVEDSISQDDGSVKRSDRKAETQTCEEVRTMRENLLIDKSIVFAARIIKLHKHLIRTQKETIISKQIVRSGTSIGANINEANYGQSKADFISKMHIALKETAETEYWLRLLLASE